MNSQSSLTRRSGFTLIELLVVIAIIAILAAILFPVFARAREQARKISCLSNTKQIGTALHMYLQDYDELFPMRYGSPQTWDYENGVQRTWKNMLMPYIKNVPIFKCPSNPTAQRPDLVNNGSGLGDGFFPGGYAMWLPDGPWFTGELGHGAAYPQPLAGIEFPAGSLIIVEHSYRWADTGPYLRYCEPANGPDCEGDFNAGFITPGPSSWNSGHSRKGTNIVYMDSHAKWSHYRATFEEVNGSNPGLNAWRFNKAEMDAKGHTWVYNLLTDLNKYPSVD